MLRLVFTSGLPALALVLAIGSTTFGQSKPSADRIRQLDRMIDAMASRNKAPTIVRTKIGDEDLALFSPAFDWSDQDRVYKAIQAVREDKSDEMWWRLRGHIRDERYALTVSFDVRTYVWNISVGEYCSEITEADLKAAYARHRPHVSGSLPWDFAVLSEKNEKKWSGRPLYELQIEVCEDVVKRMASIKATEDSHGGDYRSPSHTFTAEEKSRFVSAVKKQIEELKRTKKAVTTDHMSLRTFGTVDLYHFNAENAKRMRETYEQEKSERSKDGKGK